MTLTAHGLFVRRSWCLCFFLCMRVHLHISERPFFTDNQSVNNREWKKISCENSLTLLSVSVWSCPLYIAPHWRRWLLCGIKTPEERWACGAPLQHPSLSAHSHRYPYPSSSNHARLSGVPTVPDAFYNVYVTVLLFVQYANVCIAIVCLCMHLCVHIVWYACMQTCMRVVK